jgi:hypothetical protein
VTDSLYAVALRLSCVWAVSCFSVLTNGIFIITRVTDHFQGCCSPASQPLPRRVVSVSVPVPFCCARRIASKHTVVLPGTYERASHYPHSHSSLSPSLLGEPPSWYSAYALSDVLFCFPAMMHARDIDTGTCDMAAVRINIKTLALPCSHRSCVSVFAVLYCTGNDHRDRSVY